MATLHQKAEQFIGTYGGEIVGPIPGKRKLKNGQYAAQAYRIKVGDFVFHIYYARSWYWKYDGITIPEDKLQDAVNENAVIVIFIGNTEYWRNAQLWMEWAEQDHMILHNRLYNKTEAFIKRRNLARPPRKTGKEIKEYFPIE